MWLPILNFGIFDLPTTFDTNQVLLTFVKLLLVVGGLIYVVFAILIIRQIQLMSQTIKTNLSNKLMIAAVLNLVLAIIVLLFFLTI